MTSRWVGDPNPHGLPGEDEALWSIAPRRREPDPRPAEERLRIVRETWVEPTSASRLRARLSRNINQGQAMAPGRGAFVIGPPGAGTSTFLQETARDVATIFNKRVAIAYMPDRLKLHDILVALRTAVGRETDRRERTDEVESRLYEEVGRSNVIAIALDGMEQLLHVTPIVRSHVYMWLRHAAKRGNFHLILSTPPALVEEMHKFLNTSVSRHVLPAWIREAWRFQEYELGPFRIDAEYVEVLARWERRLPLRHASHLTERELALHLYALCDGLHGRLARVLRRAAAEAIASGRAGEDHRTAAGRHGAAPTANLLPLPILIHVSADVRTRAEMKSCAEVSSARCIEEAHSSPATGTRTR